MADVERMAASAAARAVQRFAERFGDGHLKLACCAALPLVITPELLNYLRSTLLRGQAPWVAEVDLLLSELCTPVGYEQYAMDPAVRAHLLGRADALLGPDTTIRAARLLIDYLQFLRRTDTLPRPEDLQSQEWGAMAFLADRRDAVVREIAESFVSAVGSADHAGLARLVETCRALAGQIAGHQDYAALAAYAGRVGELLAGSAPARAVAQRPPAIGGVTLPDPSALALAPDGAPPRAASDTLHYLDFRIFVAREQEWDLSAFLGLLTDTFTKEELQVVGFDLGLDPYDVASGASTSRVALELIQYCQRRDMLDKLFAVVQNARPNMQRPMRPVREPRFAVSVAGPAGEAISAARIPNDGWAARLLAQLDEPTTTSEQIDAAGSELFDLLFREDVRTRLNASLAMLHPDQRLRLRLDIQPDAQELDALPWELLRDPAGGQLALSGHAIVRYQLAPPRDHPIPMRVALLTSAAPADQPPLGRSPERELQAVARHMHAAGARVVTEPHLTRAKLRTLLEREQPDIWHFFGYGSKRSEELSAHLLFEDEAGTAERVPAELLVETGVHIPPLVVLNGCFTSELAAQYVRSGARAAVGWQGNISTDTAHAFSAAFYEVLANSLPIDIALTVTRVLLWPAADQARGEWATPVLYTSLVDGRLFEPGAPPAVPAETPGPTPYEPLTPAEAVREDRPLAGAHILWVDDRPENNKYERGVFERDGATCTLSRSTDEALEAVAAAHFDAIISDMGRPGDTRAGYTLFAALQERGVTAPFIVYSVSSGLQQHREEGRARGMFGITHQFDELVQLVTAAVQGRAPGDDSTIHDLPR